MLELALIADSAGMTAMNTAALERAGRRERLALFALTTPALTIVAILLVVPLVCLFWQSVIDPQTNQFTAANYTRMLSDPVYASTFQRTLLTSATVTALCFVLGYPIVILAAIAYSIQRRQDEA